MSSPQVGDPTEALLRSRLRACREMLLDFESGVVRLPTDLATTVRTFGAVLDAADTRVRALYERNRERPDLRDESDERNLFDFTRDLIMFGESLTVGTTDATLPNDLIDLIRREHVPDANAYPIILMATAGPIYHAIPLPAPLKILCEKPTEPLQVDGAAAIKVLSFVSIPRSLLRSTLFHVSIVAHELVHIEDKAEEQRDAEKLQRSRSKETARGHAAVVVTRLGIPYDAKRVPAWILELLADAIAVRRYGPAAALVFAELARAVSAYGAFSETHPAAELRLAVMTEELGALGFFDLLTSDQVSTRVRTALAGLQSHACAPRDANQPAREEADAYELTVKAVPEIRSAAARIAPQTYQASALRRAGELADEFARGIARSDRLEADTGRSWSGIPQKVADLFNGAAVVRYSDGLEELAARMNGKLGVRTWRASADDIAKAGMKLDDLLGHALAGVEIAHRWPRRKETESQ